MAYNSTQRVCQLIYNSTPSCLNFENYFIRAPPIPISQFRVFHIYLFQVHINLGAGESEVSSPHNLKLNDLEWHHVKLIRNEADIQLILDNEHTSRYFNMFKLGSINFPYIRTKLFKLHLILSSFLKHLHTPTLKRRMGLSLKLFGMLFKTLRKCKIIITVLFFSGHHFQVDFTSSIFTMEFLLVEWGTSMKYFWGIRRISGAAWRMFILTV